MKAGFISKFKLVEKFNNLNAREKLLAAVAAVILTLFVLDRFVIAGLAEYQHNLSEKINEKKRLLATMQKYVSGRETRRLPYDGTAAGFLDNITVMAGKNKVRNFTIRKTDYSDHGLNLLFTCDGRTQDLLNFIQDLDEMKFLVFFRKMSMKYRDADNYQVEADLFVARSK